MKERRTLKPGTGIATILLIFVVLAMTILAVLSYLHASQNHQSVTRQIEYAQAYSKAEARAAYLQDQVKHGHFENVESNEEGYTYSIEIVKGQNLFVQLDKQGNALIWKTIDETEES